MRKITSLTLLIASLAMLLSSAVLYIVPVDRVAYWGQYRFLWLSKSQWGDIHMALGTLIAFLCIIHFFINIKRFFSYLRNKEEKISFANANLLTALIIVIYIVIAALIPLPPMDYILDFGEKNSISANKQYGEPPYEHAEMSSLSVFCKKIDIDADMALERLQNAGYIITDPKDSLTTIAKVNDKTPQKIYLILKTIKKKAKPNQPGISPVKDAEPSIIPPIKAQEKTIMTMPTTPQPGFADLTLVEICKTYGLNEEATISTIRELGYRADTVATIKEIATQNNTSPMNIFDILYEISANK